jgi:hypothetical protein
MFKTTERALKKEKYHVLLVKSSIMSKKRIKKIKVLSLKQRNLLEASRKTMTLVIIMARKEIGGGITMNTLQP